MTRKSRRRATPRLVLVGLGVLAVFAMFAWVARPEPGGVDRSTLPVIASGNRDTAHGKESAPGNAAELIGKAAEDAVATATNGLTGGASEGAFLRPGAGESPETVAADKRGAQMVWPATGNISTYFHEAGPYWVGGYHQGLDIAAWWGYNVFAAWDGVVIEAQDGWNKGYGTTILIDHGNGVSTRYAHLETLLVEPGDKVWSGELIGFVGSSGASGGPHLHFEVLIDGDLRDPLDFLPPDPEREYVG